MNIKGIFSLVRVFSKNGEMQMPDKRLYKVFALCAVLGIMIPCVAIVGFISYVMTEALVEFGNPGGGMLFEMQILSAFSMIFGILVIFAVLFFSSDREHFVTLPIPTHHLMMSKFIYSYLAESIMEFMVLVAVFVGYFIAIGRNLGLSAALNPISIIASILGVAAIPLIPMIYCAIFSLILMATLSGVKDRRVFYNISSIILFLFAGLFVLSLRGIGEINMENYVESLGSGGNLLLKTMNVFFFTVPWLSEAVSRGSIIYLLLYIAGNVLLLVALYFIGKALYQKGLYTAASLGSSRKEEVKKKDIADQSFFMASLSKEYKVIMRTKAFNNNCAYINLIWPVGVWALFHFTKNKGGMASFIEYYKNGADRAEMILLMAVVSVAFIATALNSLASTAFTREGQHLELIKFIPVPYSTQMYAKMAICFMFTYPALIATDIVICIYMGTNVMMGVFFAILMLMAHIISIVVGMGMDSNSPYTEWGDEYSALRGNLNVFFNMAVMMLIAFGVILVGLLMYELLRLPILAYYIAMFLILAGGMIFAIMKGPKHIINNMKKLCN